MNSHKIALSHTRFTRDQLTWVCYILLGVYAYIQAAPGPLMPFIQQELHFSYTVGSLHMSLFALGMIFAGIVGDRLTQRWSRRHLFWIGMAGIACGATLFIFAHAVLMTLIATFMLGALGSLLLVAIQATLADHHGERRTIALTEANIIATAGGALAPLCLSGLVYLGWGWRGTLLFPILLLLTLGYFLRPLTIPEQNPAPHQHHSSNVQRLPRAFWLYWTVLVLSVSTEWCIVFWGADFLVDVVHLQRGEAALAMSLFFITAAIVRIIGSRLAHHFSAQRLLLLFVGMALVGFPALWFGPGSLLHIIGLCVTGAGAINLYPLALSIALDQVPTQANAASARSTMGAGIAILLAPLTLGVAADHLGLQLAFGIILVLILFAGSTTLLAHNYHDSR